MNDDKYFKTACEKIIKTRNITKKKLVDLGFNVLPSKTNFLFVSHNKICAKELFLQLREGGILVRYFQIKGIDNFLRITIGTDEEMSVLLEKLSVYIV